MLKSIQTKNFTLLPDEKITFGPGLNVLIGANGTGKTHLMKLAYACMKMSHSFTRHKQNSALMQNDFAEILVRVFNVSALGKLTTRKQGLAHTEVNVDFESPNTEISLGFSLDSLTITNEPVESLPFAPVFIPTKELLTFYPWLLGVFNDYHISIDQTIIDTCFHLLVPLAKGPRVELGKEVVHEIEKIINGKILRDSNDFYLEENNEVGRLEIELLSEGHRKLGMLSYLLLNGTINKDTTLFWDEPEANLNPQLLKLIAEWLTLLASKDFQVVIATHSLNLMKEIHLASKKYQPPRYFSFTKNDGQIHITQSESLTGIGEIASLEADLELEDRFVL